MSFSHTASDFKSIGGVVRWRSRRDRKLHFSDKREKNSNRVLKILKLPLNVPLKEFFQPHILPSRTKIFWQAQIQCEEKAIAPKPGPYHTPLFKPIGGAHSIYLTTTGWFLQLARRKRYLAAVLTLYYT